MSTSDRRQLATTCGRVTLAEPTKAGGYWRLEWYEDGKRCQTTGGRTEAAAKKKAAQVIERLDRDAQPQSRERVEAAVKAYLRCVQRKKFRNHANQLVREIPKSFQPYYELRCENLTKSHVWAATDRAITQGMADHVRSYNETFLDWGRRHGYFHKTQAEFLEGYEWTPPTNALQRPTRQFQPAPVGEVGRFVTPDQVPTHEALDRLGDAFQEVLPYGKLLIEFVYCAGHRSGEFYKTDIDDIDLERHEVDIAWQVLSVSGPDRLARPKYDSVRFTNFPDITPTGFHLYDELGRRIKNVEAEHGAGSNPRRLLFPAPQGGWWWGTTFAKRFGDAAEAAGWPSVEWEENGNRRRLWVHTMHSLRHRFARDRIDLYGHNIAELQAVGGWKSAQVVWERYYGQSADLRDSSVTKILSSQS